MICKRCNKEKEPCPPIYGGMCEECCEEWYLDCKKEQMKKDDFK